MNHVPSKRPAPRARNFVAKHSATLQRGAGAHRDKKNDYQRRGKYQIPLIRQRDEYRPVLILAA